MYVRIFVYLYVICDGSHVTTTTFRAVYMCPCQSNRDQRMNEIQSYNPTMSQLDLCDHRWLRCGHHVICQLDYSISNLNIIHRQPLMPMLPHSILYSISFELLTKCVSHNRQVHVENSSISPPMIWICIKQCYKIKLWNFSFPMQFECFLWCASAGLHMANRRAKNNEKMERKRIQTKNSIISLNYSWE